MYTWKHYSGSAGHKSWGVYTPSGELLTVCLYRKGAIALCDYLNQNERLNQNIRREYLVQRQYRTKKRDLWINCHETTRLELAEYYISSTSDPENYRILVREIFESEFVEVANAAKKRQEAQNEKQEG